MAIELKRAIDYEKFRLEQYKSLRDEVIGLAAATRRVETYIIGATAALYAYFAKNPLQGKAWVWYLPVLLVYFGAWRSYRLFKRMNEIYRHIRQVEVEAHFPKWKTHVGEEPKRTTEANSGRLHGLRDFAKKKARLPWTRSCSGRCS